MSGWLAIRTDRARASDADALERLRARGAVSEWRSADGLGILLAWRRPSGEHPPSGRLYPEAGGCVAWLGLCLEDRGDATPAALHLLRRPPSDEALAALNGEFAAAVADPDGGIRVYTDRHARFPVYLVRGPGVAAASSDPAAAIAFIDRPRFDLEAVDLLLRCGELLDDLTPLKDLRFMPPGSRVRLDPAAPWRISCYWRPRHAGDRSLDLDAAAREAARRLQVAVRRMERTGARLVAPLSGGLDSRLCVGLCERPALVPTFTWGRPGCRDLRYAEAFARRVGSPHRSLELRPDVFPDGWAEGAAAVGGCVGVRDMYVLPFAPVLASAGDVALNGLAGDGFLGGNFLRRSWLRCSSPDRLAEESWLWRTPEPEISLTAGLVQDGPPGGSARALWTSSLRARQDGRRPVETLVDWLLDNRVFRFTNAATSLLRQAVESYSPFFDRDVVDLLVRVPLEARRKHRFYLDVLRRACPAAAAVPWQRTGIAPRWGYAAALASLAFHRIVRIAGRGIGVEPFPGQAVASPAAWFRGPWAAAAREILLGERTLGRGLLRPDGLRRLWAAHQEGADASRALGAAIGLELFARRFVDAPRPVERTEA